MQFLEIVKLVVSLLPIIIDAIKVVEAAIPVKGAGPDKLALVKSILENTYTLGTDVKPTFDSLWPVLSKIINSSIALFNAKGWA